MRIGIPGTRCNPHPESRYMLALWSRQNPSLQIPLVGYDCRNVLSPAVPMRPLPDAFLRFSYVRAGRAVGAHRPHGSGRRRAPARVIASPCLEKSVPGAGQGDRQAALAYRLAERLGAAVGGGTGIPGKAARQSTQAQLNRDPCHPGDRQRVRFRGHTGLQSVVEIHRVAAISRSHVDVGSLQAFGIGDFSESEVVRG